MRGAGGLARASDSVPLPLRGLRSIGGGGSASPAPAAAAGGEIGMGNAKEHILPREQPRFMPSEGSLASLPFGVGIGLDAPYEGRGTHRDGDQGHG